MSIMVIHLSPSVIRPQEIPATGALIGTPASMSDRVEAQTEPYDVFYGPVTDRDGNVRVAEGESMTDEVLLNEFNWYVEGVVINEE